MEQFLFDFVVWENNKFDEKVIDWTNACPITAATRDHRLNMILVNILMESLWVSCIYWWFDGYLTFSCRSNVAVEGREYLLPLVTWNAKQAQPLHTWAIETRPLIYSRRAIAGDTSLMSMWSELWDHSMQIQIVIFSAGDKNGADSSLLHNIEITNNSITPSPPLSNQTLGCYRLTYYEERPRLAIYSTATPQYRVAHGIALSFLSRN